MVVKKRAVKQTFFCYNNLCRHSLFQNINMESGKVSTKRMVHIDCRKENLKLGKRELGSDKILQIFSFEVY